MDWILFAIFCTRIATNFIGVVANVLLIYLVLKKTPKELGTYSILLFNFGISDLLACSSALLIQSRIITANRGLYLFFYGPCKFFGSMACLIGYASMMHSFAYTFWSLVFMFAYRYYVLQYAIPKKRTIVVLLILLYLPAFYAFVTFSTSSSDAGDVKLAIEKEFGYNITSDCVSGYLNTLEWKTLIPILYSAVPTVPFYIIIMILRQLTILKLRATRALSDHSRQLHSQLLKAPLTIQATMPSCVVISTVLYGIAQLNIYHNPYLEYSTSILLGFLAMLNPLTSLYFIRPYRELIKRSISKAVFAITKG